MKIKYIFIIILLILPFYGIAQRHVLRGIVKDNKETLVGATVYLANSDNRVLKGVTTNENGEYFLELPESARGMNIVFSFVGYKTQVIQYTGQMVLNVTLEDEFGVLQEVTVSAKAIERNAFGVNVKDMGVARQKIDLEELQDMPVTSLEDMLQGKLANVDIISSSGDPGARASIRIRGTSSLNASNEPLIVLDGIALDTEIDEEFSFSTATEEEFGALVNISPSDIESIEVLKDAAATALWGAKAANGVLLITTKKGVKGKPSFSVTQKVILRIEPKPIPMLNARQYVTLMQDALWNKVNYLGFPQSGGVMEYLTQYKDIRYDPDYKYFREFSQETDWLDLITQNSINSSTDFSMRGGGDRATYYFSATYASEKGTTVGTGLKQLTTRLNVDYRLSDKLRISSNFSYAEADKDNLYTDSGISNPRNYALTKMPNMSPWVLDEDGNPTKEYFTNPIDSGNESIQGTWASDKQYNPLALVREAKSQSIQRNMRIKFNLDYTITRNLRVTGDIAFDMASTKYKKFLPSSVTGVEWTHSDYNKGHDNMADNIKIATNFKLFYHKVINELHSVVVTGMAETNDRSSKSYSSAVSGIGSVEVSDPTSGGRITTLSSSSATSRSVGFMGNMSYTYDNRYSLNGAIRYDGNSKMGRNSRWGAFPSFHGTWKVHEENFMKDFEWLEELRLRASWGKSGRAPDSNHAYIGTFGSDGSYMEYDAISPNSIQLNNLKWEKVTSQNYGFNIDLFQGKFAFAFEVYKQVTNDLLQSNVNIQSTTGYGSIAWFNSGKIDNRGWEIMIDMRNIITVGDLRIGFSNINLSRNRNRVLEMPSNILDETYTNPANGKYAQHTIVGSPLGSFYGYKCLGVYQNQAETVARDRNGNAMYNVYDEQVITTINGYEVRPGFAKYADINYDGVIDKHDMVYLGNSMPILTGGGSLNMYYRDFSFRASLHTRIGQSVINRTRINLENMHGANNQSKAVLNRWRYEGDKTDIPIALYGEAYNYLGSDRFVEKATFVRLKDIMLSYSLPRKVCQRINVTKMSFTLTAYDPFT
ncbi:MAG: SusC/RagA family TonB-linked outer membrane protein [Odoribacter sp.]|nr:SusC/RagA family TonB-linked outer membrane protein [Odoribacter sp.]